MINTPGQTTGQGLLSLGRGGNSSGSVLVSGAGSRIDVYGDRARVVVANDFSNATGNTGVGLLHVTQGGVVATHATGTETVSFWIGAGLGTGTAIVDSGGKLILNRDVWVSNNTGSGNSSQTGILVVNDTGFVKAPTTYIGNGTSASTNGILAGTGKLTQHLCPARRTCLSGKLPGNSDE